MKLKMKLIPHQANLHNYSEWLQYKSKAGDLNKIIDAAQKSEKK